MRIRHHPDDALMLAYAAGSLGAGHRLLLDVHLEGCAACRQRMAQLNALGGVMLDELPPAELSPHALERVLARIDAGPGSLADAPRTSTVVGEKPWLPVAWPAAMSGCEVGPWRWMGPGMYWNRVVVPDAPQAKVFMLRIGAGRMLPQHTHSQSELTQVLWGAFDDGRSEFRAGDFDETDGSVRHQPTVQPNGDCICLASVEGTLRFDGWLARLMGASIGM
ncbi:ChrR family anti-sigma-E factor [Variovorax dokdonensis]|uniref:ChrR family anti-sigma-E factor n=1 Tax=Variovorax dokdonensis TaxID=344883 RepID=A0ABT7N9E9_9BURK|nr:ChrR family anti-sigma-E factor [Variovorax dokdonensis]MDM0044500.1 ChrR family anti-sigma-E factor [Variovorax dokdonensis]